MSKKLLMLSMLFAALWSQTPRVGDNMPGQPQPPKGKVTLSPHEWEEANTLETLIRLSTLIVDGTVISSLPPVMRNPNQPTGIETDSVIVIDKVLSGKAPTSPAKILLVQQGGALGGWDVSVPADPLVKPGQRYIFFLRPDVRGLPADATGYSRYFAANTVAGKVRVTDSAVTFLPQAHARLHVYDNSSLDTFLTNIADAAKGVTVTTPRGGIPWPGAGAVAGAGSLRKE